MSDTTPTPERIAELQELLAGVDSALRFSVGGRPALTVGELRALLTTAQRLTADEVRLARPCELFCYLVAHADDERIDDALTVGDVRRAVRERAYSAPAQRASAPEPTDQAIK